MRIAVAADERVGVAEAVLEELREARPRGDPARRPDRRRARRLGLGLARRRPATSPRAAPSRRSSAAGPGPAPRSPPTRCAGVRAALCVDAADRRRRAALERRQRARAQPARDLGGRAGRDPRRLVRRAAERGGRGPRQRRPPRRDRAAEPMAERRAACCPTRGRPPSRSSSRASTWRARPRGAALRGDELRRHASTGGRRSAASPGRSAPTPTRRCCAACGPASTR